MKLKGKVALITGGGTGIGSAVARRFVDEGAKVCITGRREELLDKELELLPAASAVKCAGDVSKPEDVERMVATAIAFGGQIDILVNNAGVSLPGSVTGIDLADWYKTLDVNLTGPFLCMRAIIPYMIKAGGGSIINIASVGGLRCIPERTAYCTSKAALIMLTQQAAIDYGPDKIKCNVVCPGVVKTDMIEGELKMPADLVGTDVDGFLAVAMEGIPLRRPAIPDEIGSVCAFLASDDSSFMTGSVLTVDGGGAIVDVFPVGVGNAVTRLLGRK